MGKIKVFISSVQSEFALERKALAEYIRADSLLGKFFDPFIFEELPAVDLTAPNLYLKEVGRCNIYLGLIGAKYGYRDSEGVSPTEREYNKATQLQKTRLIFLTYHEPVQREQEVNAFIKKIEKEVVRSRFIGLSSLLQNVYHSLIRYLEENRFIQLGPFDAQINQAVEFVMSQLDFRIGTRSQSNIAPGSYEIPREVVTEGIVNAIVHRNYANNASVEVILYKDRLEISNPGSLPLGWTTERLKQLHNSVPHNPFIAHPMYLAGYIEQLGTGTEEMVQRMKDHGLPEPKFIQELDFRTIIYRYTPQATPQLTEQPTEQVTVQPTVQPTMQPTMQDINSLTTAVKNLIKVLEGAMSREELQEILELKNRDYFRINYINTALDGGWIEMTEVESNHPNQKYRLTEKGLKVKEEWKK